MQIWFQPDVLMTDYRAVADTAAWDLITVAAPQRASVTLDWSGQTLPANRLVLLEEVFANGDLVPNGTLIDMGVTDTLQLDSGVTNYYRIRFPLVRLGISHRRLLGHLRRMHAHRVNQYGK